MASMERLRNQELRGVLSFLEALYQPTDLQGFLTRVSSSLRKLVPSDSSGYNKINPRTRQVHFVIEPKVESFSLETFQTFQKYLHEHPIVTYYARTGDGRAVQISDFLTHRQWRRLPIYNEVFRPRGIAEQIAVALPGLADEVVGFSLSRSGRPYSGRERLVLDLLRPHLSQAYQNAEMLTKLMQMMSSPDAGEKGVRRGMLMLTNACRIGSATSNTQAILSSYFERPVHNQSADVLPETLERWLRHHQHIRNEASEPYDPPEPFVVHREDRALIIRMLTQEGENVLLMEEREIAPATASLESIGLSQRESEILIWIVRGRTNREIGVLIGASPRTVSKHLEHVYAKLNVRTRTDAAIYAVRKLGLGVH